MPTSSGNVWFRLLRLTVTLLIVPVRPETRMFDGYGLAAPELGMTTGVAFENVVGPLVVIAPSVMVNVTVPKFVAPSCSCSVRVMLLPQDPAAVKAKSLATLPLGAIAP